MSVSGNTERPVGRSCDAAGEARLSRFPHRRNLESLRMRSAQLFDAIRRSDEEGAHRPVRVGRSAEAGEQANAPTRNTGRGRVHEPTTLTTNVGVLGAHLKPPCSRNLDTKDSTTFSLGDQAEAPRKFPGSGEERET